MTDTIILDKERQEQAKKYARIQRLTTIVDFILGGVYAVLWLVTGWSLSLRLWLEQSITNPILLLAAFLAIFGGIAFVLDFPLSLFTGYILPRRFELSTQNLKGWLLDELKSLAIGAPLGLILLEIIYLLLRLSGETWWLWASGFMLLINVIFAIVAPVVLMPIFNKYKPLAEEYQELAQRLILLAERAGTHIEGVYQFDMSKRTKSANAALTGLGKTRRIILGDTLLEKFTPEEIEAVMAHEIGHQINRDIPYLILINTFATLIGFFLAGKILTVGVALFGLAGAADPAALPLFGLALGIYSLVSSPIMNIFSRSRERMADAFSIRMVGNGEALANGLTRLANQNLADIEPHPVIEFLFHSHPALKKRISMAREAGSNRS